MTFWRLRVQEFALIVSVVFLVYIILVSRVLCKLATNEKVGF